MKKYRIFMNISLMYNNISLMYNIALMYVIFHSYFHEYFIIFQSKFYEHLIQKELCEKKLIDFSFYIRI